MQNRYFGDVGDFGKYGLLRILCGLEDEMKLKLGVVWYLFPDEGHNADGKHIAYLQSKGGAFRDCDELLYDKLSALLFDDLGMVESNRHVSSAKAAGILPEGTLFYDEPLSYVGGTSLLMRVSARDKWFANALSKTASADLVFVDPDNGIECLSVKRTASKGPKYIYWEDIDAFVKRGQSIVIYHHLNRNGQHLQQVDDMLGKMKKRYGDGFEVFAATYRRGTSRTYFIIASPQYSGLLRQRLEPLRSGPWSRHFVIAEPKGS